MCKKLYDAHILQPVICPALLLAAPRKLIIELINMPGQTMPRPGRALYVSRPGQTLIITHAAQ